MEQLGSLVGSLWLVVVSVIGISVTLLGFHLGARVLRSSGLPAFVPGESSGGGLSEEVLAWKGTTIDGVSAAEYEWMGANIGGGADAAKYDNYRRHNTFEQVRDAWERRVI